MVVRKATKKVVTKKTTFESKEKIYPHINPSIIFFQIPYHSAFPFGISKDKQAQGLVSGVLKAGSPVLFKEEDWSGLASKSCVWSHFKFTKEDSLMKEV